MNETYEVKNLILGKIYICKQYGGRMPIDSTSNETYIFYKKENQGKNILKNTNKIKEVFTDDEYEIYQGGEGTHNHIFNKPYIVNIESILEHLNPDEIVSGIVTKWRIIEIYNQINFEKQNNKQKTIA